MDVKAFISSMAASLPSFNALSLDAYRHPQVSQHTLIQGYWHENQYDEMKATPRKPRYILHYRTLSIHENRKAE